MGYFIITGGAFKLSKAKSINRSTYLKDYQFIDSPLSKQFIGMCVFRSL